MNNFIVLGKIKNFILPKWLLSFFNKPHLKIREWSYLKSRIERDHSILEYGSGYSTIHLSRKNYKIHSIEHNLSWFVKINNNIKKFNKAKVHYVPAIVVHEGLINKRISFNSYIEFPKTLNKKFNIVIIDGRERVKCAKAIINLLHDDHKIFIHDWNRKKYHKVLSDYRLVRRIGNLAELTLKFT